MTDIIQTYPKIDSIDFKSIELSPYGPFDKFIDISRFVLQCNIFEDITSHHITGNLVIEDALNLIQTLPIIGREKVRIRFRTPGSGRPYLDLIFFVYKTEDIERSENQKSINYKLYFISKEAFINQDTRIQKSLKGNISTLVKTIFEDSFDDTPLDAEPTSNSYRFVVPNWTTFKTISFLSNRALTGTSLNEANFLFYQDLDGYKFRSLSSLRSKDPIANYTYRVVTTGDDYTRLEDRFFGIHQIDPCTGMDSLVSLVDGRFSSTLYEHDITKKTFTKSQYSYSREFDFNRSTTNNPLIAEGDPLNLMSDAKIVYRPNQSMPFDDLQENNNYQKWVLYRIAQLSQSVGQTLSIEVPGNHTLRVGNVIYLNIPSFAYTDPTKTANDEFMGGKYLISTIHHMFSSDRYICKLGLMRDTRNEPVADLVSYENPPAPNFDYFA